MHPDSELIRFSLRPKARFRLDLTVWALRRRSINTVDTWDGDTYGRVLVIHDTPVLIGVTQHGQTLNVTASATRVPHDARQTVTRHLERLLGIREDLSEFYKFSSCDKRLYELTIRFRGFKPPRFPTVFEALLNGITCQQLSLTAGITFLNRLSESFGLQYQPGKHAFPRPVDLAALDPAELRPSGYSGTKARTIIEAAQSIMASHLNLEELDRFGNQQCLQRLIALRGVGRWTAEYVLLRGLGRTSVFPGDDVGAQNSLMRWLHLRTRLDYDRVQKVLSRWREYGGLIFFHLLLKGLDEAGELNQSGVGTKW